MEREYDEGYNRGNDCSMCLNQYIGIGGYYLKCACYTHNEECNYEERELYLNQGERNEKI